MKNLEWCVLFVRKFARFNFCFWLNSIQVKKRLWSTCNAGSALLLLLPFAPHISKWLSVADVEVYSFPSLTHTEGAFTVWKRMSCQRAALCHHAVLAAFFPPPTICQRCGYLQNISTKCCLPRNEMSRMGVVVVSMSLVCCALPRSWEAVSASAKRLLNIVSLQRCIVSLA